MSLLQSNFIRATLAIVTVATVALGVTSSVAVANSDDLPSWAPTGLNAPFDPATGMFNWKPDNTVQTRASLTDASLSQQNHVFVGDSLTAGWNALTPTFHGEIDRDKTMPYYYRRAVNSKLGLPAESSTGLVRAYEVNGIWESYMDERWSPKPNGFSIQSKGHYMNLNWASMTFDSGKAGFTPVSGNTVAITYLDASNFSVSIDGGWPITVKGSKTGEVRRFERSGLSNKPHTVKINVGLGSNARIIGAEVYSDKGISAHNIAQGGSRVTGGEQKDWSVPGDPSTSMSSAFSNPAAYSQAPSTVFITLGGNDWNSNANDLSKVRDGILETANFYRNSDIVIVAEAHGSQSFSTVDIKPLLTMLYQMAYDNNWPLWDLEYFTGGYEKMAEQGLTGDKYGHLTTEGYKLLGETLANSITDGS